MDFLSFSYTVNTGNKDLQSAAASCFITSSSLTYLLLADNSLCRCPALVINGRRRDPLQLWPQPKRGKNKMKWAAFRGWREVKMSRYWCVPVSHPSVGYLSREQRGSQGAARWCLLLQRNPEAFICACVSKDTGLNWLCVTAWRTTQVRIEGMNLWSRWTTMHMLKHKTGTIWGLLSWHLAVCMVSIRRG